MLARARRTSDPGMFETYLRMSKFGGSFAGSGLVAVSLLGVLTAWQQHILLTSMGWLNAACGTAIAAFIIPPLTLARGEKQAAVLMPEAAGEVLTAQKKLVGGIRYRVANSVLAGLLVWMLVLMVSKPF